MKNIFAKRNLIVATAWIVLFLTYSSYNAYRELNGYRRSIEYDWREVETLSEERRQITLSIVNATERHNITAFKDVRFLLAVNQWVFRHSKHQQEKLLIDEQLSQALNKIELDSLESQHKELIEDKEFEQSKRLLKAADVKLKIALARYTDYVEFYRRKQNSFPELIVVRLFCMEPAT